MSHAHILPQNTYRIPVSYLWLLLQSPCDPYFKFNFIYHILFPSNSTSPRPDLGVSGWYGVWYDNFHLIISFYLLMYFSHRIQSCSRCVPCWFWRGPDWRTRISAPRQLSDRNSLHIFCYGSVDYSNFGTLCQQNMSTKVLKNSDKSLNCSARNCAPWIVHPA